MEIGTRVMVTGLTHKGESGRITDSFCDGGIVRVELDRKRTPIRRGPRAEWIPAEIVFDISPMHLSSLDECTCTRIPGSLDYAECAFCKALKEMNR